MSRLPRQQILQCYAAALAAVRGEACVRQFLNAHPLSDQPVTLLAMGKAATSMAKGACAVLTPQLANGLVVTRTGYVDADLPGVLTVREAGHPLPDKDSLAAGQAVIALVQTLPPENQLLVLTSGGTSALVEALPDGIGLADLVRLNQWLLGSGLPIQAINRVRQSVSRIKGGGLARLLRGQPALNLLISDVPGDDPAVIGAGLFYPALAEVREVELPDWVHALQRRARSVPRECGPVMAHHIIANNRIACEAACATAQQAGLAATVHDRPLAGAVEDVAQWLVNDLAHQAPGIHIWGGETTVRLPARSGRGGRNQQLALLVALQLAGREDIQLLAAGTDGSDGSSGDAGAVVDSATVLRGEEVGLDAAICLARADAGSFLEASGDLVHTGPTGTNVMDIVIACKAG